MHRLGAPKPGLERVAAENPRGVSPQVPLVAEI